MVKRYYCDYCDKTFPYNTLNRKKHNSGTQHQALVNDYYKSFKSSRLKLEEELTKKPCFKHFTSSSCIFQDQCRGSHKTLNELGQLLNDYQSEINKKLPKCIDAAEACIKIKKKTRKNIKSDMNVQEKELSDYLTKQDKIVCSQLIPKFKLPEQLRQYKETLPPSLVPPTIDNLINSSKNTWG